MSSKLLEPFSDMNVHIADKSVQTLMECENQYAKLVREYKNEIDFIQQKLEQLRKEEVDFYSKELHKIEKIMIEDEVDEKARKIWLADLQNSMKQSFNMSRNLLNDFAIKDLNEFRKKAEELIKGA